MKKKRLGMMAAAMAISLGGIMGSAQIAQSSPTHQTQQNANRDMKATPPEQKRSRANTINSIGGLSNPYFRDLGRSPKEYGQTYGCKSHSGKTNRLRLSHNAKLKRRINS